MDQAPTLRELLEYKLNALEDKIDAVLIQVEMTNGRVRKAEIAIALLQWAYGIAAVITTAWAWNRLV
jgi:hypothetical protein